MSPAHAREQLHQAMALLLVTACGAAPAQIEFFVADYVHRVSTMAQQTEHLALGPAGPTGPTGVS